MHSISTKTLTSPIILIGRGGSGTRMISDIVQNAGVFLGNEINSTGDSVEWIDVIYPLSVEKITNGINARMNYFDHWKTIILNRANNILNAGNWTKERPWGFKLPETMLVLHEFIHAFPLAKIVHIIRHPVDSSLRRSHMTSRTGSPVGNAVLNAAYSSLNINKALINTNGDHINNAISWVYQIENVVNLANSYCTPDQYLEIRYEDLCNKTIETQRILLEFINIDYASLTVLPINTARMQSYSLPDSRINEVWDICKNTANKVGYVLVT